MIFTEQEWQEIEELALAGLVREDEKNMKL
jgi:hypothetical protein